RWVDPASIVLTIPFCLGYGSILALAVQRKQFLVIRAGCLLFLLLLALSIPQFTESFANRRRQLATDARATDIMNVGMGKWIKENTPEKAVLAVNDAGAIRYFGQRYTIDIMGLNNAAIAFGKMKWDFVLVKADWLAIFPRCFSGTPFLEEVQRKFEPRFAIRIPLKEYTICNAPSQTLKVAYQKKAWPAIPTDADKPAH
ncbi:MAG: hypothetical protein ABSE63_17820, partial [Thermoguttaceae bacterium]